MKHLRNLCWMAAGALFLFGTGVTVWCYRAMLWCIEHEFCSAPASVSLWTGVPFFLSAVLCIVAGCILHFRKDDEEDDRS